MWKLDSKKRRGHRNEHKSLVFKHPEEGTCEVPVELVRFIHSRTVDECVKMVYFKPAVIELKHHFDFANLCKQYSEETEKSFMADLAKPTDNTGRGVAVVFRRHIEDGDPECLGHIHYDVFDVAGQYKVEHDLNFRPFDKRFTPVKFKLASVNTAVAEGQEVDDFPVKIADIIAGLDEIQHCLSEQNEEVEE